MELITSVIRVFKEEVNRKQIVGCQSQKRIETKNKITVKKGNRRNRKKKQIVLKLHSEGSETCEREAAEMSPED